MKTRRLGEQKNLAKFEREKPKELSNTFLRRVLNIGSTRRLVGDEAWQRRFDGVSAVPKR